MKYLLIILALIIPSALIVDKEYSEYEKRRLSNKPLFSYENYVDGSWSEGVNTYIEDHFFLRDTFAKLKGYLSLNIKGEVNGISLEDNHLFESLSINTNNISNFKNQIEAFQTIYQNPSRVIIIPDKSYVDDMEEILYMLFEYELMEMSIEDYYKTDLHLTHSASMKLANEIIQRENTYELEKVSDDFNGYYSNRAMYFPLKDDIYVRKSHNLIAYSMGEEIEIYQKDYLEEHDKYNVFFGGSKPVIEVYNDLGEGELILFTDSYGLSVAPFIAEDYAKVTIIDLRFIDIFSVSDYINDQSEIIYLYGYKTINDSSISN